MKLKNLLVYTLAVLTLPLVGTVAPAATIVVMKTIDYPGDGNTTLPQKISDQGDMVGTVIYSTGVRQGFFNRGRDGKFSAAFSAPNDLEKLTQGRGVNNKRHACGEYLGGDGNFHGYLLEHPNYTEFDISGALDTIPLGINNAGDFVGTVVLSDRTQPAFTSMRGHVATFQVPGATATFAYQLNTSNQIVGYYVDLNGITHGFTRDANGNLTFPIDVPGSTGTILFGNNDLNWVVGRYTDASGATHGLFYKTPDDIVTFDYPGSTFTSLNGINKQGQIVGSYVDEAGISHGFLARVVLRGPNANDVPVAPVKPAYSSLEMLRIEAPAL